MFTVVVVEIEGPVVVVGFVGQVVPDLDQLLEHCWVVVLLWCLLV